MSDTDINELLAEIARLQAELAAARGADLEPTERIVEKSQALAARARKYIDYATIEGKLEEISTHNGDSFGVWDSLTGKRIDCKATPEQLKEAMENLRRRVTVSGYLRFKNDRPVEMEVKSIRVLRDRSELPQPETMGPIDITGGESSEEYNRRLRNA